MRAVFFSKRRTVSRKMEDHKHGAGTQKGTERAGKTLAKFECVSVATRHMRDPDGKILRCADGRPIDEKTYYIRCYRNGRKIEEKLQSETDREAASIRALRTTGKKCQMPSVGRSRKRRRRRLTCGHLGTV